MRLLGLWAIVCVCGACPGGPCTQAMCGEGRQTYQNCANSDGTVTFSFGVMSCTCPSGGCDGCEQQVAGFCGDGAGGGGAAQPCTASFSGAFVGTDPSCAVSVLYDASSDATTIATLGNAIANTPYSWDGLRFVLAGMPATGTFTLSQTISADVTVTQAGVDDPPLWQARSGSGPTSGGATLTLDALGPTSEASGGVAYLSAHGTFTATLPDQNMTTAMPDLKQTVTF